MSKTTVAIKEIIKDLDRISGLDGGVGDYVQIMAHDIHERVEWLLIWMTTNDE